MTFRKLVPVKIEGIDTYRGGSGHCYHTLINRIRPHNTLVVPFLGNCAITRHIKQAHRTIGNDLSTPVIEKWKAMNFSWIDLFNEDFMDFLQSLDFTTLGKVAMYVDPTTYPRSTWSYQKRMCAHEMSDKQHAQLLEYLLALPLGIDVIITTMPNKLYTEKLKGWHTEQFTTYSHRRSHIEQLFCNYEPPFDTLHDYTYCGEDYREREARKKKTRNMARGLLARPLVEQRAILHELQRIVESNASYTQQQAEAARLQGIEYYSAKEAEKAA